MILYGSPCVLPFCRVLSGCVSSYIYRSRQFCHSGCKKCSQACRSHQINYQKHYSKSFKRQVKDLRLKIYTYQLFLYSNCQGDVGGISGWFLGFLMVLSHEEEVKGSIDSWQPSIVLGISDMANKVSSYFCSFLFEDPCLVLVRYNLCL